MNGFYKAWLAAGLSVVLTACGGSGGSEPDRQVLVTSPGSNAATEGGGSVGIANDPMSIDGEQSLLLSGESNSSSGIDLTISNVAYEINDSTINYQFTVSDTGGAAIPLESLSLALEVAATGSFTDSYVMPLFDIREQGESNSSDAILLSARSTGTQLPGGSYISRLVVNPNWQQSFDIVPAGSDASAFRYIEEIDYSNNASGSFQITVSEAYHCEDDGFEDNDNIATATVIPAGGQVSASLCHDNADYYAVELSAAESASLRFDYTDAHDNPNPATRYVVLDGNSNRITEPTVARESNAIMINAVEAGMYYLVLFGDRSTYRITRVSGSGIAEDQAGDNLFHTDTRIGPHSWLYGGVVLNRLGLTEALLVEQTVNCGRIATQFSDGRPVAYVTPQHFADIHEFRFLADGSYLLDGEKKQEWRIANGDVSNVDWYDNGFPGYAQRVSNNKWRYWSSDGMGYTECTLEINR